MKTYYLALCLLMLVCACKKDETAEIKGDFNFYNITHLPAKVYIYPSLKDYENHTNLFRQVEVPAKGDVYIPLADFQKDATYYIDWYTPDCTYGNWPIQYYIDQFASIRPSQDASFVLRPTADNSYMRKAFLNENQSSTTWLSTTMPGLSIVINKNYTIDWKKAGSDTYTSKYYAGFDNRLYGSRNSFEDTVISFSPFTYSAVDPIKWSTDTAYIIVHGDMVDKVVKQK